MVCRGRKRKGWEKGRARGRRTDPEMPEADKGGERQEVEPGGQSQTEAQEKASYNPAGEPGDRLLGGHMLSTAPGRAEEYKANLNSYPSPGPVRA